jgi:hypothetical protein
MKRALSKVARAARISFLIILIMFIGSCDESLPPYRAPAGLFEGWLRGSYVLTRTDNSLKVYFTIRNIFDESFQGPAELTGSIRIVSARNPDIAKTFFLTARNIIEGSGYDGATGTLLLDPGKSIRLGVSWNFVDDEGRDLRDIFSDSPRTRHVIPECAPTLRILFSRA